MGFLFLIRSFPSSKAWPHVRGDLEGQVGPREVLWGEQGGTGRGKGPEALASSSESTDPSVLWRRCSEACKRGH